MDELVNRWRGWRLKNTVLLVLGIVLFYYLAKTPQVDGFIQHLGYLGRLGALIAGFFFVSTYTVVPASYILFELAKYQSALEVAVFAAAGSMLGDYIVFRFVRDGVMDELKPYLGKIGGRKVRNLFKTPYFAWFLPVMGAVIIASPLPDELGVGLIGASKMKNTHFLMFSYVLNVIGVLGVVWFAQQIN